MQYSSQPLKMRILGKIELWEIHVIFLEKYTRWHVIGTVVIFQLTQIPPPICDMAKIRVSEDRVRRKLVSGGPLKHQL